MQFSDRTQSIGNWGLCCWDLLGLINKKTSEHRSGLHVVHSCGWYELQKPLNTGITYCHLTVFEYPKTWTKATCDWSKCKKHKVSKKDSRKLTLVTFTVLPCFINYLYLQLHIELKKCMILYSPHNWCLLISSHCRKHDIHKYYFIWWKPRDTTLEILYTENM